MSNDTLIRDALNSRADSYDLSLATLDEIAGTAGRRTRRSRIAGSATALTLAVLMVVGVGFVNRPGETSTLMFAGIDRAGSAETPSTIIATEAGWLGATLVFNDVLTPQSETDDVLAALAGVGEVYLTTSTDGVSWELADPTGIEATLPIFALDEHDGRYWLAVTNGEAIELAFSDDLSGWQVVELPAESHEFARELRAGWKRIVKPAKIVASEAGVMVKIDTDEAPDFEASIGLDLTNVCDLRWHAAYTEVRQCGMSEFDRYDLPEPTQLAQPRGGDSNLVFSADGETFAVFSSDVGSDTRLPYSSGQRLYETDAGFGLADYLLRESVDGETWMTFDGDSIKTLSSPSFAAVRDGQRVAASMGSAAADAEVLFSADGELFTAYNIGELVDLRSDQSATEPDDENVRGAFRPQFSITSLVAGDAGWAIGGWAMTSDGRGYLPLPSDETVPFSAILGEYTITGTLPAGPAELRGADGAVVQQWDGFEPHMPSRTGVIDDGSDLTFVDDQGDAIVSIPFVDWQGQLDITSPRFTQLVLFSPDGMNWTKIHQGLAHLAGVSVGDDEVVIATRTANGISSERIAIGG